MTAADGGSPHGVGFKRSERRGDTTERLLDIRGIKSFSNLMFKIDTYVII